MSQRELTEQLMSGEALADDELEDDDYCFIFDRDGKLKSAILPEALPFTAPKTIAKILKILGVRDISMLEQDQSIH